MNDEFNLFLSLVARTVSLIFNVQYLPMFKHRKKNSKIP